MENINDNETIEEKILQAMKVTKKDLAGDFSNAISKTNTNGIYANVWARRSDVDVELLKNDDNAEVLHISRGPLWQIDPVLDLKSGILYLPMSRNNLTIVRRKFEKNNQSHHYGFTFSSLNFGFEAPHDEQLELVPLTDAEKEEQREYKEKDLRRMLGSLLPKVKHSAIVVVEYVNGEAITAELEVYNAKFELVETKDLTKMLHSSIGSNRKPVDNGVVKPKVKKVPAKKKINVSLKKGISKTNAEDLSKK